jgi:PAS domain S-box-containing protein
LLEPVNVLIVDDLAVFTIYLEGMLQEQSYHIKTASSGQQALEILTRENFEIMLTDIRMPEMDGIELMAMAKKILPELQCIVISACGETKIAIEAMKLGAINYLCKPVNPEELKVAMEQAREKVRLIKSLYAKELRIENQRSHLEKVVMELRESREFLKNIIYSMTDLLLIIDPGGKVQMVNQAVLTVLGYSEDEILGRSVGYIFKEEELKGACLAEFVENGTASNIEINYRTIDGRHIPMILSGAAMQDKDGKLQAIVTVARDITEVRKAQEKEKELAAIATAAASEANNRARELDAAYQELKHTQAQLVQNSKMVSLGVLVSGIAHEINNPNHFIMSHLMPLKNAWQGVLPVLDRYYNDNGDFKAGGLSYSKLRKKMPEIFKNISGGSQRIKSIVDELRDYSRQQPADFTTTIKINNIVKSAMILVANLVKKSTDHLVVEYGEDLPLLKGDYHRLEQVVVNLLQNSCQALPDKNAGISISTLYDRELNQVIIKVSDQGCGICQDEMDRIQDPFFSTKRDAGGVGLGLSICAKIIADHGGRLEFKSKPEKETISRVFLPVMAATD